jgi:hypothetical protein
VQKVILIAEKGVINYTVQASGSSAFRRENEIPICFIQICWKHLYFQDGSPPRPNTVTEPKTLGWVRVQWDAGNKDVYRMGFDGKYDLQLLGC